MVLALFQNESQLALQFNFGFLAVDFVECARSALLIVWPYRGANETCEKQPFQIPGAPRRLVSMIKLMQVVARYFLLSYPWIYLERVMQLAIKITFYIPPPPASATLIIQPPL